MTNTCSFLGFFFCCNFWCPDQSNILWLLPQHQQYSGKSSLLGLVSQKYSMARVVLQSLHAYLLVLHDVPVASLRQILDVLPQASKDSSVIVVVAFLCVSFWDSCHEGMLSHKNSRSAAFPRTLEQNRPSNS